MTPCVTNSKGEIEKGRESPNTYVLHEQARRVLSACLVQNITWIIN